MTIPTVDKVGQGRQAVSLDYLPHSLDTLRARGCVVYRLGKVSEAGEGRKWRGICRTARHIFRLEPDTLYSSVVMGVLGAKQAKIEEEYSGLVRTRIGGGA